MIVPKSKKRAAEEPTAAQARGRPRAFDRGAVLERAMLTFWRYGYEGASITHLTQQMGISAQSLYAAFGSKTELYKEAMTLYRSSVDYAACALQGEVDVWAAVRRVLFESADRFTKPGSPAGCMLSAEMLHGSEEHGQLAQFVRSLRHEALATIKERFHKALQDRQLQQDVDVEGLARLLYATVLGMAVQARDGASEQQLRSIAEVSFAAMQCFRHESSR